MQKFEKLPTNIGIVQSLKELIVFGCSNLVGAADELVKLKSLKVFHANDTDLNQLLTAAHEIAPSHALSFPNWVAKPNKNLKILSFVRLPSSLVTLSLARCNLSDDAFLNDFGSLPLLQNLFLGGIQFVAFHISSGILRGSRSLIYLGLQSSKRFGGRQPPWKNSMLQSVEN